MIVIDISIEIDTMFNLTYKRLNILFHSYDE